MPKNSNNTVSSNSVSGFVELCCYKVIDDNITITIEQKHLNAGNIVHGGLLSTILDHACALPFRHSGAKSGVTVNLNVSFLAPAYLGDTLTATGRDRRMGETLAYADGEIVNQNGKRIATASVVYKILS